MNQTNGMASSNDVEKALLAKDFFLIFFKVVNEAVKIKKNIDAIPLPIKTESLH